MNRAIKSLLKDEPKALKALNEVFHIDWQKPFQAVKIDGKTTIKQILKKIDADDNTLILVLNFQGNNSIWKGRYQVGIIDNLEHVEVDFKPHYFHADKVDTYYSKGDFRDDLKHEDISPYHIIIAQDKALLTPENDTPSYYHHIDMTNRYRISNDERAINHYSYKCDPYIDRVNLIETTNDGKYIEYHTVQGQYKTDDINQVIDKSGYIVELYRQELYRKAKALKAERAKNAYLASDNTKQIEELRIRITAKKLEIIEMLKAADTSESLKEVSKCLESWRNGYASIVESFEKMQKSIENKSYSSIEDFNRHYTGISNMLLNNGKE